MKKIIDRKILISWGIISLIWVIFRLVIIYVLGPEEISLVSQDYLSWVGLPNKVILPGCFIILDIPSLLLLMIIFKIFIGAANNDLINISRKKRIIALGSVMIIPSIVGIILYLFFGITMAIIIATGLAAIAGLIISMKKNGGIRSLDSYFLAIEPWTIFMIFLLFGIGISGGLNISALLIILLFIGLGMLFIAFMAIMVIVYIVKKVIFFLF